MSAQQVSSMPRPSPKPHLLSLPTEILQSIYLFCLSPHLTRASPVLTSALSADIIYKLTFLHAFWDSTPLVFAGTQSQKPYEPGPNVRSLFQPLPLPRVDDDNDTQAQKANLQKTVLAYQWCTFHRARRYFSSAIEAITRDLFITLDISLSPHDQMRFDYFIAPNFPACCSTFQARALDGSHLTLEYPRRLATALLMTNLDRSDSRLDLNTTPNVKITPTKVLAIPNYVLVGKPEWTEEKVDLLQMLCSYVNLRSVQYELSAFNEGMKNAILQGNHDALLVLIWQADRLAEYKVPRSDHENPFEPPAELFRLVARCGMRDLPSSTSVKLFTLLLRAHAESMPQHDTDITAWATHLFTCQDGRDIDHTNFAQWVLDWSSQVRSSYFVKRFGGPAKVKRPLFRRGGVSRGRENEMARRFWEIDGVRGEGFGKDVERVGRRRDWHCGGDVGAHVCSS